MLARGDNGPADPAWLRDRLSDGKCLKIAVLSFSTSKIVAVLLFYSSLYDLKSVFLVLIKVITKNTDLRS